MTLGIRTWWTVVSGLFEAAQLAFQGDWSGAWEAVKGIFGKVWADIQGTFSGVLAFLKDQFAAAGPALLNLLKQGLDSAWGSVIANVQGGLGRVAALLPHSYADEGPLSEPVSWEDVILGDLPDVISATVATVAVGAQLIEGQFEQLTTAIRAQRMGMSEELLTMIDDMQSAAAQASAAVATIAQAAGTGGDGGGDFSNAVSSAQLEDAMRSFQNQTHAAILNAGTAATGISPGWTVPGAAIQGAQTALVSIDLDGQRFAEVIAPILEPELSRVSHGRVGGV
jgi:hypothetical protein